MPGFQEIKPKDDHEWLGLRAKVLTATDIGVILGLNKWKSVNQMIEGKKNFEPINNFYMYRGQQLEKIVVQDTNTVLRSNFKLFENGSRSFFADFEMGLGATPDAGDTDRLLECKSTKPANALKWSYWPPSYYLMQLYTQMYCINKQEGLLSISSTDLSPTGPEIAPDLSIFRLQRSPELDIILEEEVKRFWTAQEERKLYRVNRQQSLNVDLLLRFNSVKIK